MYTIFENIFNKFSSAIFSAFLCCAHFLLLSLYSYDAILREFTLKLILIVFQIKFVRLVVAVVVSFRTLSCTRCVFSISLHDKRICFPKQTSKMCSRIDPKHPFQSVSSILSLSLIANESCNKLATSTVSGVMAGRKKKKKKKSTEEKAHFNSFASAQMRFAGLQHNWKRKISSFKYEWNCFGFLFFSCTIHFFEIVVSAQLHDYYKHGYDTQTFLWRANSNCNANTYTSNYEKLVGSREWIQFSGGVHIVRVQMKVVVESRMRET